MDTANASQSVAGAAQESAEMTVTTDVKATRSGAQDQAGPGSAEDAVSGAVNNSSSAAAASYNRKMIYQANVVMRVDDYDAVQSDIYDLIHLSGAYIVRFSDHQNTRDKGGTFVIKVPSSGFHSFLDQLDELDERPLQRSITGQDVTEEYVDLEARLKAKQVVEARLLSFMEKATAAGDLVSFSNELARVQEEIEVIQGRMRYLDQNVAFSTVELRVVESGQASGRDDREKPAYERAGDALLASLKGLERFFEAFLVFLAGALPIVFILSIPAMIVLMLYRRSAGRLERKKVHGNETLEARDESQPLMSQNDDETDAMK